MHECSSNRDFTQVKMLFSKILLLDYTFQVEQSRRQLDDGWSAWRDMSFVRASNMHLWQGLLLCFQCTISSTYTTKRKLPVHLNSFKGKTYFIFMNSSYIAELMSIQPLMSDYYVFQAICWNQSRKRNKGRSRQDHLQEDRESRSQEVSHS